MCLSSLNAAHTDTWWASTTHMWVDMKRHRVSAQPHSGKGTSSKKSKWRAAQLLLYYYYFFVFLFGSFIDISFSSFSVVPGRSSSLLLLKKKKVKRWVLIKGQQKTRRRRRCRFTTYSLWSYIYCLLYGCVYLCTPPPSPVIWVYKGRWKRPWETK